jgi:hypothetical protein
MLQISSDWKESPFAQSACDFFETNFIIYYWGSVYWSKSWLLICNIHKLGQGWANFGRSHIWPPEPLWKIVFLR